VPNAGALGVLIAVAEFATGVALVAGLFTRVAALGSLALLFAYVMSGTASVCAFYALFAVVILVMRRTSSWTTCAGWTALSSIRTSAPLAGFAERRRRR
jgi:uncharacterized membrane protein YphA (DoxX/SURF4 family)